MKPRRAFRRKPCGGFSYGRRGQAMQRTVFYVSDGTGITAETLGHSLLTQFETIGFERISLRFVDSIDKARQAVATIDRIAESSGAPPLVFSTLIDPEIRHTIAGSRGAHFDFFESFLKPLEEELGKASSHTAGRAHGVSQVSSYADRIRAVNFALHSDDGAIVQDYDQADVILIGVSRTGKTPTSLYLAMHYGMFVANYPLTADDLTDHDLPMVLQPHRDRLFGLTIDPERLQQLRSERLPDSRYASLRQCRFEVRQAEAIYRTRRIAYLDISNKSVEEIAASLMDHIAARRQGRAVR